MMYSEPKFERSRMSQTACPSQVNLLLKQSNDALMYEDDRSSPLRPSHSQNLNRYNATANVVLASDLGPAQQTESRTSTSPLERRIDFPRQIESNLE